MPTLGSLYRKYLRGADLEGNVVPAQILDLVKVVVTPPPAYSETEKWCLVIKHKLGDTVPNRVILGPQGERQLVAIFGRVPIEDIKGKIIELQPKKIKVAGRERVTIRFNEYKPPQQSGAQQPQQPPEPADDPPF